MKKLRYYIIVCIVLLVFFMVCDNVEYNVIDNVIYLEEFLLFVFNNMKLMVDGEVMIILIIVCLGQVVGENVIGIIEIDFVILMEYNEKYFIIYEVLLEKFLFYNKNFEIKVGEIVVEVIIFMIKNFFNDNGELYVVFVCMKVVEGVVFIIGEFDYYIILLDKVLIQLVFFMNILNVVGISMLFGFFFFEWFIEIWVWMDGF